MEDKLRKLQMIEVEILDEIVRICEKYKITYYLYYGTLIGAIRHKGFIPWDDDLDIVMPRKDFDKFCEIGPKEINNEFFFHSHVTDPNSPDIITRIRKKDTVYAIKKDCRLKLASYGCWVDIYPLDNADENKIWLVKLQQSISSFIAHVAYHRAIKDMQGLSIIRKFVHICSMIMPLSAWVKLRSRVCQWNKNDSSKYYMNFTSLTSYKYSMVSKKAFGIPEKKEFEGKLYNVPKNWDYVLRRYYGNYMELPPQEERINTHMPDIWEM